MENLKNGKAVGEGVVGNMTFPMGVFGLFIYQFIVYINKLPNSPFLP